MKKLLKQSLTYKVSGTIGGVLITGFLSAMHEDLPLPAKQQPAHSQTAISAAPKPPEPTKPVAKPVQAQKPKTIASPSLHTNITTTVFWVGEAADATNDFISNASSAWDDNWKDHFGGFDDPNHRNGYYPIGFTPLENPFYIALPYNDFANGVKKSNSAQLCPSGCKNRWVKIMAQNKTAYAQWQDVGPGGENDDAYVFGSAQPKNAFGVKAGLDISPAVRDYLGLGDVSRTNWEFVSEATVPNGPWKAIVTRSGIHWQ